MADATREQISVKMYRLSLLNRPGESADVSRSVVNATSNTVVMKRNTVPLTSYTVQRTL